MNQTEQKNIFKRRITTFAHRKKTTKAQQRFLDEFFPIYGLPPSEGFLDFAQIFNNSNPIVLEIGFGMGDSLLAEAIANPDKNFVGVEVYPAGVGKLLGAIADANLQNLRIFKADAIDVIDKCIKDNSIDEIKILFPDPWQKARHNKRRIIQPEFIEKIHRILKISGVLVVATDWQDYAEHIAEVLLASKLKSKSKIENKNRKESENGTENGSESDDKSEKGNGAYSERFARPITKYESKAIEEGREIFNFEFYKI